MPENQSNQNAAKRYREIAERYESEHNTENAIEFYEKAAELFGKAQLVMSVNYCNHKAAQHAVKVQRYSKAIKIYEKIASHSLNDSLVKYQAKRYLIDAGTSRICRGDDVDSLTKALERYQKLDPTLSGTLECQLLAGVAISVKKEFEAGGELKILLLAIVMAQACLCLNLPGNHKARSFRCSSYIHILLMDDKNL